VNVLVSVYRCINLLDNILSKPNVARIVLVIASSSFPHVAVVSMRNHFFSVSLKHSLCFSG